jgi:hypothetical protein
MKIKKTKFYLFKIEVKELLKKMSKLPFMPVKDIPIWMPALAALVHYYLM